MTDVNERRMTRFTVTFDADLDERRNTYSGGTIKNISEAVTSERVEPDVGLYLELASGDVVRGTLVEIREGDA